MTIMESTRAEKYDRANNNRYAAYKHFVDTLLPTGAQLEGEVFF